MLTKFELRNIHSKMEDERANSYSILSQSQEYRKTYLKYISVVRDYQTFINKKKLAILNLGFGTGILENILLSEFDEIEVYSVDNSLTFNDICYRQNFEFINSNRLKLYNIDLRDDPFPSGQFDIIFSHDLNHHLNNPQKYINQCINSIKIDGILIIEDLRYDADLLGIKKFSELINIIPLFSQDRWNFYHKMLGLYESFAVSYNYSEIEAMIIESERALYHSVITQCRYHFIIYLNNNFSNLFKELCAKLK